MYLNKPIKLIITAVISYLLLGWLGSRAIATLTVNGRPLNIPGVENGQVLVRSGLADYSGLSFFTTNCSFLRHSNYQLVVSKELPNILNRDITTLYDSTFQLEPIYSGSTVVGHYLQAVNIAFYRLSDSPNLHFTHDPKAFGNVALNFNSSFGWLFLFAGRYRAIIITLLLIYGLFSNLHKIGKAGTWLIYSATGVYLILWGVVFQPGLFTYDSIRQLTNATTLQFDTMHPPIMATIAAVFLRTTGIAFLIKLQAIIGIIGLLFLVKSFTKDYKHGSAVTAATVALLISPLFPFTPYLFTFWKDAWAGICVVWIAAILVNNPSNRLHKFSASSILILAVLILAVLILTLVRHNSIVLVPLWGLTFAWYFRTRLSLSRAKAYLTASVLLLGFAAAPTLLNWAVNAKPIYGSNQIYLLELLGAQKANPRIAAMTPYLNSQITDPEWRDHFDLSRNDQLFGWGTPAIVSDKVGTFDIDAEELRAEYWKTWKIHPLEMVLVKLKIFEYLLTSPRSPYANGITDNSLGIRFNDDNRGIRNTLFWLTERVWNSSSRILCSPTFNILSFLFLVLLRLKTFSSSPPLILVSAIWGGLYLVFLLACPTAEYRYLFPAILLGTVVVITRGYGITYSGKGAPANR